MGQSASRSWTTVVPIALRRLAAGLRPSPTAGAPEMARAGAYLYGAGGVLVAASLLLRVPGARPEILGAVGVVAVAVAGGLWRWGHRLAPELYPVLTALGTVLVTLVVRFGGEGAQAYSFIYVWAALYAFYFYEPLQAMLQVALIGVACGLVGQFGSVLGVEMLMLVGTVIIVGRWTQQSIRRVQSLART